LSQSVPLLRLPVEGVRVSWRDCCARLAREVEGEKRRHVKHHRDWNSTTSANSAANHASSGSDSSLPEDEDPSPSRRPHHRSEILHESSLLYYSYLLAILQGPPDPDPTACESPRASSRSAPAPASCELEANPVASPTPPPSCDATRRLQKLPPPLI
jgi:hypothetical protein